ncbi:DUF4476 domain-containing protein [Chitinophaga sp. 212800010-3]|uniref:DUF4476 domain-containing protein n=1 Tax=unclassified Chitinophaga TaxID=2619133 RepID=UPI002DF4CAD4|nr:DUF4476 domain-containing protein [Chitinophaga sp. 212800010-3]
MHRKIRTAISVLACMFLFSRGMAQGQRHYVYIQSEKGQPFYVKYNGKVLSSTERGYIIIPQLETGTAPITVGFPKNASPEAQFSVRIAKNDQGFLLKKAGDGYSLYNLQTFRELKANSDAPAVADAAPATPAADVPPQAELDTAKKEMMTNLQKELETTFADKAIVTGPAKTNSANKQGNSFSSALDKVVVSADDRNEPEPVPAPAPVVKTPVAAVDAGAGVEEPSKPARKKRRNEREPLTEEEQALLTQVMADESKTAASEAAATEVTPPALAEEQPVKKHKKHKAREGEPDFIEFQDDKTPAAAATAPQVTATAPVIPDLPATEETSGRSRKKKHRNSEEKGFANVITDSSGYGIAAYGADEPVKTSKKKKKHGGDETTLDAAGAPVGAEVAAEAPAVSRKKTDTRLVNSDCSNIMDEGTFRKVLRKFVAARTDNSMIDVFQKQTRNYCLETSQVKTLVQLLTGDDTRYRLLDAAYSKTYDSEKYSSLESLLIDDYYKGRFKAMLHK